MAKPVKPLSQKFAGEELMEVLMLLLIKIRECTRMYENSSTPFLKKHYRQKRNMYKRIHKRLIMLRQKGII